MFVDITYIIFIIILLYIDCACSWSIDLPKGFFNSIDAKSILQINEVSLLNNIYMDSS
jgi:hypothetical protein